VNKVVLKAIRITGDLLYQHGVFPIVIEAIKDGRLDKDILGSMITTKINLDDVEEKGIKELINNKSRHIKILIKVNDDEVEDQR
jgi:threonine dehydrogenase-like Zn-dependent dehydrogenase